MIISAEPNCVPLDTLAPDVTELPFAGITPEELETLRSLVADKDIARIRTILHERKLGLAGDDASAAVVQEATA